MDGENLGWTAGQTGVSIAWIERWPQATSQMYKQTVVRDSKVLLYTYIRLDVYSFLDRNKCMDYSTVHTLPEILL